MFGIDLAVSIMDGPELSEHRRKELALARLMAETIGVILYTGDLEIRIDAAKDMIREFRGVYEETKEPYEQLGLWEDFTAWASGFFCPSA